MLMKNTKERIWGLSGLAPVRYSVYDGEFLVQNDVDLTSLD